jgi:acyl-CoA synthetase (AMP-forming)/AMP-acid ligase II
VPPGVLHTHGSLSAQVGCLSGAWAWRPDDRILHALPLHHVHGIVNALLCAHANGAAVEFAPRFSPSDAWARLMVLMLLLLLLSLLLGWFVLGEGGGTVCGMPGVLTSSKAGEQCREVAGSWCWTASLST